MRARNSLLKSENFCCSVEPRESAKNFELKPLKFFWYLTLMMTTNRFLDSAEVSEDAGNRLDANCHLCSEYIGTITSRIVGVSKCRPIFENNFVKLPKCKIELQFLRFCRCHQKNCENQNVTAILHLTHLRSTKWISSYSKLH